MTVKAKKMASYHDKLLFLLTNFSHLITSLPLVVNNVMPTKLMKSTVPIVCHIFQVYENSPSTEAAAVSQSTKSSYPCKKCGVIFTGYYELVKHQKRVCMKNNIVPLPFGNQVIRSEKIL